MEAAKKFKIIVNITPKNLAGSDAKAPAVILNDSILAEIGGLRDGKISELELLNELSSAGVPTY